MEPQRPSIRPDSFAFSALLSGAYASAAVALLFLIVDAVRGEVLFTPSLLGSVLLLGETPSPDLPVRLDMVAYYSLIHFGLCALLGSAASAAYLRMAALPRRPLILGAGLFVVVSAAVFAVQAIWVQGLVDAMGHVAVVSANLTAAVVMAGFIHRVLAGDANVLMDPRPATKHPAA